LRATDHI